MRVGFCGHHRSTLSFSYLTEEDIEQYNVINKQFHDLTINASGNPAIQSAMQLNEHLPFASVNALVFNPKQLDREFRRFNFANMQHHVVFDALLKQQGARAEAVMKEHAHATLSQVDLCESPNSRTCNHSKKNNIQNKRNKSLWITVKVLALNRVMSKSVHE